MTKISVTIDGQELKVESGQTILDVCRENEIDIPTMCHFEGLSEVGACRLCLVEIEGSNKLMPSCTTQIQQDQVIRTQTDKLKRYQRMITELFFCERHHICAVCIANGNCDLQKLAYRVGMDHVTFPNLNQQCELDASHPDYVMDHNRCIMCTRCVRVCSEVEGAHNWGVMKRGFNVRIISDFNQPWGESTTCTSCGKCVEVCPTGALWPKNTQQGSIDKDPGSITALIEKRRMGL
ncbi:MAG: bidirectional hydrogenase complex protein HoxU [Candidatus Omnitrophica bacterium]|nr:bidirectional hydrogenase complex protein HoxU [Candidatus Omnitrophota bacterium]